METRSTEDLISVVPLGRPTAILYYIHYGQTWSQRLYTVEEFFNSRLFGDYDEPIKKPEKEYIFNASC